MEILSARRKGRRFLIADDSGAVTTLTEEVFLKRGLRVGQVLSDSEFREIREEDAGIACREAAFRLLAVRAYGRDELFAKLAAKGFGRKVAEGLLVELERLKLVDDRAFARNLATELVERGQGRRRVQRDLYRRGLAPELIEETLGAVNAVNDEAERAQEVAARKAALLAKQNIDPRKKRERLVRFLAGKGFPAEIVYKTVGEILKTE